MGITGYYWYRVSVSGFSAERCPGCLFGVCVPRLAEPEYFWYDTALLLRRLGLNLVCVVFNGYGYAQAVT